MNASTSAWPTSVDAIFHYEAMGFVAKRADFVRLEAKHTPPPAGLWAAVRELLAPLGFTGVEEVYLTEDDGQGASDIKVFVVVKLKGPASLYAQVHQVPNDVEDALDTLSEFVCCIGRTDYVGAESWEFSNHEDFTT